MLSLNRCIASLTILLTLCVGARSARADDAAAAKEAARAFFGAIVSNDSAAIEADAIGTPLEMDTVRAMGSVLAGQKKFAESIKAKFPNDSAMLANMKTPDFEEKLKDAQVTIDGDHATILSKDAGAKPLMLKKVDGVWKVELSTMQLNAQQMPPERLKMMGAAMSEVAGEVSSGKFESAQQAMMSLGQKMQAIMAAGVPGGAATQPSSK